MATLITNASGNLTGTIYSSVEVGAGAFLPIRFSHNTAFTAAGTSTSIAFTVTSGKVIDGVVLWLKQGGPGSTGTFKVALNKGGVEQASVTVNKTDLPDNTITATSASNQPVFFKFTGTATGDGAANWTLVVTTTGTNGVYYSLNVTGATNWTRILRTTTPAAAPAAGDDLFLLGELTGAGTHNSFAITMDSTATTVYGNGTITSTTVNGGLIAIGAWCTLSYPTTASINSILRIAGDLRICANGTLNIGSTGAEIPRSSTAVLEFNVTVADGDFGIFCHENSTFNTAGLSRTAGKNINRCKLTANPTPFVTAITTGSTSSGTTVASVGLDATGNSLTASGFYDAAATAVHYVYWSTASLTNTVQTMQIWLRWSGYANSRYLRLCFGNATSFASMTSGFWADIDFQTGTVGSITNNGTGVGTSITLTPMGGGYLVRMTGKVSTASATPSISFTPMPAIGTTSYLGTTTYCFYYQNAGISNASSIADSTFTIDTDTGWLNGDAFAVSSTSRTPTDAEIFPLTANAGASSLTTSLFTSIARSGTSPTQAEVILITRNVRVRSISGTFMAYIYVTGNAKVNASWTEFAHFGGLTGKRGIEIEGSNFATQPKTFDYCSIHDFDTGGIYNIGGYTSINCSVTNSIFWLTAYGFQVNGAITNTDWVCDNNIFMRNFTIGIALADVGGVCTNNIVSSQTGSGDSINMTESNVIGTFNNNVVHSGGSPAVSITGELTGVINNLTVWRCPVIGVSIGGAPFDLVFNNLVLFGNTPDNISGTYAFSLVITGASVISGETAYPTTNGITLSASMYNLVFSDLDMSGVGFGGILAPHTNDFNLATSPVGVWGVINNCKFGAPYLFVTGSKALWTPQAYLSFQKFNQVIGDHRTEMRYGQIRTDTTIYHTSTPSLRLTPNSASGKLKSAPDGQGTLLPVANGSTIGISVYVRKSDTSTGFVYNGNQPRLIQRANAALGQSFDLVLATAADTPTVGSGNALLELATSVNISGVGLTATNTGTTATDQGARPPNSTAQLTGKYYFEVRLTTFLGGNNLGVGVGLTSAVYSTMGASATGGCMVYGAGTVWLNGVSQGAAIGARVSGDYIGIAVDRDNGKIWFRAGAAGNWDGNAAHNPATNTGGYALPAGAMVPFLVFGGVGGVANNVMDANFGQSAFVGAVPAGFTSGWPGVTSTSSWVRLDGTSSVANLDDGVWEFVVDCDGTSGWVNVDDWEFTGVAVTSPGMMNWFNGKPIVGGGGAGGSGSREYFSVSIS